MKINLSKEWLARQAEREENAEKQTNEKATSPEETATPIRDEVHERRLDIKKLCDKIYGAFVRKHSDRLTPFASMRTIFEDGFGYGYDAGQESLQSQLTQALKERDEAVEREEKYKTALEHYADDLNWNVRKVKSVHPCEYCGFDYEIYEYDGDDARKVAVQALSEGKEK